MTNCHIHQLQCSVCLSVRLNVCFTHLGPESPCFKMLPYSWNRAGHQRVGLSHFCRHWDLPAPCPGSTDGLNGAALWASGSLGGYLGGWFSLRRGQTWALLGCRGEGKREECRGTSRRRNSSRQWLDEVWREEGGKR